ncbi:ATP-binding protein [Methylocystis heyeri]|uniref:histidine kinase n=1 Tax=Methylocystis heyeri TaxID=391905 RepID=A0A6B8KGA0_9HYPH|nr:ATP-binding protein [Methylocystis heyeri]QGM46005.1 response regulator [Methylocystis heyeri]
MIKLYHGFFGLERQAAPQMRAFESFFVRLMKRTRSAIGLSVAMGALFAAIGVLVRVALVGYGTVKVPYVTFFPFIAFAAVFGGWPSGIAATLFSAFALHGFFVPLVGSSDWINLAFFLGSNVLTVGIVELLYRAQIRAIKAVAARKALEWSAARDQLLSRTAMRLLQGHDPSIVVGEMCRDIIGFVGCDVFFNFLFDEQSERQYLNACGGLSEQEVSAMRALDCARAACSRLTEFGGDAGRNPNPLNCPQDQLLQSFGVNCCYCRPLLEQGRILGTLTFADRKQAKFEPAAMEVMDAAGNLISLAISRLRMETALRQSEERFSSFMSHLSGNAWIKDEQGRFIFANEALSKIAGKSLDQILGRTDEELFGAEAAALYAKNDRLALEDAVGLTTREYLVDHSGARRHFLVSKFPIITGYDDETYVGGIAIDDTQRVQAEERLQEATARLKEADRRKDEFLAMLAHELRNPLAPLRAGLDVLRRTGRQGPGVEKIQGIMERQVEHLVRLVDDLLEVSRISRGVIELKYERLDLNNVVSNAAEACRQLIEARKLEFRLALPAEPLWIEADPVRIAQVVSNLLNNAAKYTDPGGRIELGVERRGCEAVMTVADTGIGIPADMLTHVFDLFAQIDRTIGRAQGGLGIGLALVRDLVRLHGGEVTAESKGEGQGSRFLVRLPLAAEVAEEKTARQDTAVMADAPRRRALIVDDMRDVADSLALQVESLNADVRVAYSGLEGLELLAEFKPEVVFLDIGMPGMDGFETARRMRRHPQGRDVVLVALTGWGENETRRSVEAAGFDRHLIKPAETDDLRRALELADHALI